MWARLGWVEVALHLVLLSDNHPAVRLRVLVEVFLVLGVVWEAVPVGEVGGGVAPPTSEPRLTRS